MASSTSASGPARRGPGRPRSAASHRAVLEAAAEVLDRVGWPGFTVDEVAHRSGVSKAVIYKHWRGGLEIALEAYAEKLREIVPVPDTGDARADLTEQVRTLAAVYAGSRGGTVAQLLGAAMASADSEALRQGFFAKRRADTVARIRHAAEAGQLKPGVDPEMVVDVLFGGIVFRLVNGREPLDPDGAAVLAQLALDGVAAHPGKK